MNNSNSTESDSEEEVLVYIEFENSINIGDYTTLNTLDLSEQNPIIQLGGSFYKGTYENPLGTYMFFEEDTAATSGDQLFDKLPEKNLKYMCKTRKFLKTDHAYVKPKENIVNKEPKTDEAPEDNNDIELVAFKTVQQGLDKFKEYWEASNKEKISDSACKKSA